jgi:hypothetical protein
LNRVSHVYKPQVVYLGVQEIFVCTPKFIAGARADACREPQRRRPPTGRPDRGAG